VENKDKAICELQEKILLLESKVEYLQGILLEANISYEVSLNGEANSYACDNDIDQGARIIKEEIKKTHFRFFYSMFKGRLVVF
jgi:hypothetical protein